MAIHDIMAHSALARMGQVSIPADVEGARRTIDGFLTNRINGVLEGISKSDDDPTQSKKKGDTHTHI